MDITSIAINVIMIGGALTIVFYFLKSLISLVMALRLFYRIDKALKKTYEYDEDERLNELSQKLADGLKKY